MAEDAVQEKVQTAVALQSLTSEIGFVKGQLTEMSNNMKASATKSELEEVKKDFNKTIEEIRRAFEQHNKDDKDSFGGLSRKMDEGALEQRQTRDTIKTWGGALLVISFLAPIGIALAFHFWWG